MRLSTEGPSGRAVGAAAPLGNDIRGRPGQKPITIDDTRRDFALGCECLRACQRSTTGMRAGKSKQVTIDSYLSLKPVAGTDGPGLRHGGFTATHSAQGSDDRAATGCAKLQGASVRTESRRWPRAPIVRRGAIANAYLIAPFRTDTTT